MTSKWKSLKHASDLRNDSVDRGIIKGSRVSPSDTVIELKDKKDKKSKWRSRRTSSSSGSGFLSREQKRPKTFIARNFYKRECFKYVEVPQQKGKCSCGLERERHPDDVKVITDQTFKWGIDQCTRRVNTDSYGEIKFSEDGTSGNKPYVRISDDTKAKNIIALMRMEWKLELPNLVISVTGGAKNFNLKPRLKEVFNKGLIKVVVSTGAWIITGGTNAGVMKHVGEAVKNRGSVGNVGRSKINVIGISPWGVLSSSNSLVQKNGQGNYPAKYNTNEFDTRKTFLDNNHSHFLLVDNGTTGRYGTEIELRSRVEGAIAQYKTESNTAKGAIGIPVVILCLEGGPNTIKTMAEAIKRGTPAVVIDGSGRAADVVCFAYKHLIEDTDRGMSFIDPRYVNDIQDKVAAVFGNDNMERVYKEIEELLKDEKMITVFRLDDASGKTDMDLAILTSLLKANKASFQMQLKLALTWNRIDVAKSEIFTDDLKRGGSFKIEQLYEPLFTALMDNKPDFVELFLLEGVNLKQFLTLEMLELLYHGIPQNTAIKYVINAYIHLSKEHTPLIDMFVIGHVIEELMGDRFKCRYKTDRCYTRGRKDPYNRKMSNHATEVVNEDDDDSVDTPYLDLFTWAVLCNRRQLALLIWERMHDSIAAALMASKLLKSLAEEVTDNKELHDMVTDLMSHAREYEIKAVGVLEECRIESDKLAQALLVKELPHFGGVLTSIDIAVSADDQDFIAHASCQTLFNRLWMGELYINTETLKILVCIFVPFLINSAITFHEDRESDDIESSTTIMNPNCFNEMEDDNIMLNNSMGGSENSLQKDYSRNNSCSQLSNTDEKTLKHEIDEEIDELDCDHDHIEILGFTAKTGSLPRIVCFHDAPFVKFVVNVLSYTFFLLLYSFVLLTKLKLELHPSEFVLQGWVFTLLCEEIRQLASQEPKQFLAKLEFYFQDPWNIADIASIFGFIVPTVLRYVANYTDNMNYLIAARIIYSSDVVIFILRLLQIFSVNPNMGPKLVMIRKMLNDLVYFVVILAVFVIGYGVASQAVLFPNSDLWDAIIGVVNKPYWLMYGELFADDLLETKLNCTTGQPACMSPDSDEPCKDEYGAYVAPVYMALYMLFTNILLLNLLIAIFNYTFEKVQEDSDKVWKFQRYDLITEYRDRPSLCPPFIIFAHIYYLIAWLVKLCGCCGYRPKKTSSLETQLFSSHDHELLSAREFIAAETYIYNSTIRESETQDERVKAIFQKVNFLTEEIGQVKFNDVSTSYMDSSRKDVRPGTRHESIRGRPAVPNSIELRLAKMEYNLEQVLELMIQQNQKQAAILEASQKIMSNATGSPSKLSHMESKITTIHTKSRLSPYPGSMVHRFKVPDGNVPWEVDFHEYKPVIYTASVVLAGPYWADVDLLSISPRPNLTYNTYDGKHKVNRTSHVGFYDVVDGLPRNPYGRTGIIGRGSLGRFGPNHAADPIATRWKRSSSGILLDRGKRVLEFIAIQRRDNHQWAIPGGMVEPGEHVSETLRKEFTEEALAKLDMSEEKKMLISERIAYLFRNGVEVYKGYVDDPRNTDNAWMETVACNFHDDTGEIFGEFQLQAGDDAQAVRWQRVSGNIPLFASHVGILEQVAKMHGAAFQ